MPEHIRPPMEGDPQLETEKRDNKIIVEIGSDEYPVLYKNYERRESFENDPTQRYIHIDLYEPDIKKGKERLNGAFKEGSKESASERALFIIGPEGTLPVADSVASEIVLANVFGSPQIRLYEPIPQGHREWWESQKWREEEYKPLIDEIYRISKDGALVKIVEDFTPKWSFHIIAYIRDKLKDKFSYRAERYGETVRDDKDIVKRPWSSLETPFIFEFTVIKSNDT